MTHAVITDTQQTKHVLDELNIKNCDAVVVAIGENIEASILCAAPQNIGLKNLGQSQIKVAPYDFKPFGD